MVPATSYNPEYHFDLPTRLKASPNPIRIAVGQSVELAVTGKTTGDYFTGAVDVQLLGDLASQDSTIATVDGMTITGVKKGTTSVTLTSGDATRTYSVEVVDRVISEVVNPAAVTTPSGTAPTLPSEVSVKYADGGTGTAAVTWDSIAPAQYSTREASSFTVSGSVAGTDKKAQITVNVQAATVTSIEEHSVTTTAGVAPSIPGSVQISWSNNETTSEDVNWEAIDPAKYQQEGATFDVAGTTTSGKQAVAHVTVGSARPTSAVDVEVSTIATHAPELPDQVTVKWSNNTTTQEDVQWDDVDASKYEQAGTFDVNGTVTLSTGSENGGATARRVARSTSDSSTELTVTAHVTVQAREITTVEPVEVTTDSGVAPVLPDTVNVTYNDNETSTASVQWGDLSKDDYTLTAGGTKEFATLGTVLDGEREVPVKLVLNITAATPVEAVNPSDITTPEKVAPVLPNSIEVKWSDDTTSTVSDVVWEAIAEDQYAAPGEFDVKGTVTVGERKLQVSVHVNVVAATITGVENPAGVETPSGTAPQLPSTVKAQFSNGQTSDVAVEWEAVDAAKYRAREGGTFTVTGTVAGWDQPVTIEVTVLKATIESNDYESQTVTVDSSASDELVREQLAKTAKVTWSNGETTTEPIDWTIPKEVYASRAGGTFTVEGTVAGMKVTATVVVNPATVKSVTPPAGVTTTVGTAPKLPATVVVNYSNGDAIEMPVLWADVAAEDYGKVGSFKVAGTVTLGEQKFDTEVMVEVKAVPAGPAAVATAAAEMLAETGGAGLAATALLAVVLLGAGALLLVRRKAS